MAAAKVAADAITHIVNGFAGKLALLTTEPVAALRARDQLGITVSAGNVA